MERSAGSAAGPSRIAIKTSTIEKATPYRRVRSSLIWAARTRTVLNTLSTVIDTTDGMSAGASSWKSRRAHGRYSPSTPRIPSGVLPVMTRAIVKGDVTDWGDSNAAVGN